MIKSIQIANETAMLALAGQLASLDLKRGIIYLLGNLGAGKTTFVRGFLRQLGYMKTVKSPTYTLVEPYSFESFNLFHFDLYRVHDPKELDFIGLDDYFNDHSICFVEWPEKGAGWLPKPDLSCYIESIGAGREVKLVATTPLGLDMLKRLKNEDE